MKQELTVSRAHIGAVMGGLHPMESWEAPVIVGLGPRWDTEQAGLMTAEN